MTREPDEGLGSLTLALSVKDLNPLAGTADRYGARGRSSAFLLLQALRPQSGLGWDQMHGITVRRQNGLDREVTLQPGGAVPHACPMVSRVMATGQSPEVAVLPAFVQAGLFWKGLRRVTKSTLLKITYQPLREAVNGRRSTRLIEHLQ